MRQKIAASIATAIITVLIPALVFGMIKVDPSWGWPLVGICLLASGAILIWGFSEHHLTDWRKKMWPLGLMGCGFAIYCAGAIWYFATHVPKSPVAYIASEEPRVREQRVADLLASIPPEARKYIEQMATGARPAGIPDNLWRPLEASGIFERDFTGPKGIVPDCPGAVQEWLRKHPPLPITLHDFFKSDFPNTAKLSQDITFSYMKESSGEKKTVTVVFQIYQDFSAHAEFIGIYIPMTDDAYFLCAHTLWRRFRAAF